MTEPEAIERIVLAQEAQAVALESIQRLLFQLVELQKADIFSNQDNG